MNKQVTKEDLQKSQQAFAQVVQKYHTDASYKAKVDADPAAALREAGMDIPAGTKVNLLHNTDNLVHIVLPATEDS